MHKIGIDARLYSQTGVGVYLRNLLYFLEKITNDKNLYYIYLLPDDYDKVKFTKENFIKRKVFSRWHTFSEQLIFAFALYRDDLDLMHFTYFGYPVLYKRKFIATIHDSTPLTFKTGKASTKNPILYKVKFQAFKFVISQQVKHARILITPTETVKKHLIGIFGAKYSHKIHPIYEGVDFELIKDSNRNLQANYNPESGLTRNQSDKLSEKPFVIYVGNFYPHKNVNALINAFAKVNTAVKLILIGPDDYFSRHLLQYINKLKQADRIIFFHNPTREDLIFFYQHALALIHPSLSEGFGLPIVESMHFNLPIIASDIAVFREILSDKYIAFAGKNPDDIADKIRNFLKNKKKYDYSGIINRFSFENMARETLKLYSQSLD